jgi:catechol 2,3-dioxygenase-like lactoylglutathione lyase family enzyme
MALQIGGYCLLLQIFDMPTSIAFYRDTLGFNVASDVPSDGRCDWAMLDLNGSRLMLNTAYESDERPSERVPTRAAAHSDTALFFDCADVDGAFAHLGSLGVEVSQPVVRDYGMKQIYLKDPDGYEICLQERAS